jgi:alkylation response protein AidB-like acyl-CoA dehydrogenase
VDLLPTSEQLEIVAAAAAFVAKEHPLARIRELRDEPSAVDPRPWARSAELGWFALAVPEEQGGVGYTLAEEALLFREVGRGLAPGPFIATVLAARVALAAGAAEVATAIMAGEAMVALAQPVGADAEIGAQVRGSFELIDAVGAPYVLAVGPDGAALVATEALGEIVATKSIDPAVRLAHVDVDGVPAVAFVPAEQEPAFLRGCVLASAMSSGIAEATRDMAAEYAKVRVQFAKPIGVNQAIKHRCADMAVRAEVAGSQVLFAALSVETARADAAFQVAAAKVVATDAAVANAGSNIQVHGGMGYTYEHDAHLYLKRAHVLDHMFGRSRSHLAHLIELPPAQ